MSQGEGPLVLQASVSVLPWQGLGYAAGCLCIEAGLPLAAAYLLHAVCTQTLSVPALRGAVLGVAGLACRYCFSVLAGAAVLPASRLTRQALEAVAQYAPALAASHGLGGPLTAMAARDAAAERAKEQLLHACSGRELVVVRDSGARLSGALCLPRTTAPVGLVVLLGGNGQLAEMTPPAVVKGYTASGLAVAVLNYRGVGRSTGLATRRALVLDTACATARLARHLALPLTSVALVGHSIGGGVAAEAALALPGVSLALDRTFARLGDAAVLLTVPWACRGAAINAWWGKALRALVSGVVSWGADWGLDPFFAVQWLRSGAAPRKVAMANVATDR